LQGQTLGGYFFGKQKTVAIRGSKVANKSCLATTTFRNPLTAAVKVIFWVKMLCCNVIREKLDFVTIRQDGLLLCAFLLE
jgi:hypothetical protein